MTLRKSGKVKSKQGTAPELGQAVSETRMEELFSIMREQILVLKRIETHLAAGSDELLHEQDLL